LSTCLGGQFTIVEENEHHAHTLSHESVHNTKYMALDTAEELTYRAYRDTPRICAEWAYSKEIKHVFVRTGWSYATMHDWPSL
jgi:hypothetical protein